LALKDEAVVDASWIAKERQSGQGRGLRFLFMADDALGSANLSKRIWHKAYLGDINGLKLRSGAEALPKLPARPERLL
jgi:hypothetical protein